jgi:hypothetical protein
LIDIAQSGSLFQATFPCSPLVYIGAQIRSPDHRTWQERPPENSPPVPQS